VQLRAFARLPGRQWQILLRRIGDGLLAFAREHEGEEFTRVPSEKGAKTSYLVPEAGQLYLAVGGAKDTKAGLLRYAVAPSAAK